MTTIEVRLGDITDEAVDAIVNAANSSLLGGGGVDGAIHRVGGPRILADCEELRRTSHPDGLPTAAAVATTAGDLRARFVIHTVGPKVWEHVDGGADLLADCHRHVLDLAGELRCRSVAFPAISCGVYGWNAEAAAPIALRATRAWLADHPESTVERIRFVLFDEQARDAFAAASGVE